MRIDISASKSAYRNLNKAYATQSKSLRRIATGRRINSAADDASGLAAARRMLSDLAYTNKYNDNLQDTINMNRAAEEGLGSVQEMTGRMTELAAQAASDTYSSTERQALQDEFNQLSEEINRIGNTFSFNGKKIFGATGVSPELSTDTLGISTVDFSSSQSSREALAALDSAGEIVNTSRSNLGALENALTHRYNSTIEGEINLEASISRIMDADIAKESVRAGISEALGATSMAMLSNSMEMMKNNALKLI